MKKRMFRASIGLATALSALGLAGCSKAPAPAPTETAWSDPAAPSGITVSDGKLALPAVAGNPAAVYFTIRNAGDTDYTIRSAWVSGADSATLHQTTREDGRATMSEVAEVALPAGKAVEFAPGGLHVMAMNVGEALEVGGDTEVTLTFATGDKVSFPGKDRGTRQGGPSPGEG